MRRCSSCVARFAWSAASTRRRNGSKNASAAFWNDTPCLARLAWAFWGSQTKRMSSRKCEHPPLNYAHYVLTMSIQSIEFRTPTISLLDIPARFLWTMLRLPGAVAQARTTSVTEQGSASICRTGLQVIRAVTNVGRHFFAITRKPSSGAISALW